MPTTPEKYGYTFMGWKPYTRIEYLESTRTQYIDTGISWTDLRYAHVIIDTTFFSTNNWRMIGLSGAKYGGINVGLNGSSNLAFACDGDRDTGVKGAVGVRYMFDLNLPSETFQLTNVDNDTLVVDMANISTAYVNKERANFYLFGYNDAGPVLFAFRLYSAKLYDKGTLVHDMVPMLDPDNIPCMFDFLLAMFLKNLLR